MCCVGLLDLEEMCRCEESIVAVLFFWCTSLGFQLPFWFKSYPTSPQLLVSGFAFNSPSFFLCTEIFVQNAGYVWGLTWVTWEGEQGHAKGYPQLNEFPVASVSQPYHHYPSHQIVVPSRLIFAPAVLPWHIQLAPPLRWIPCSTFPSSTMGPSQYATLTISWLWQFHSLASLPLLVG